MVLVVLPIRDLGPCIFKSCKDTSSTSYLKPTPMSQGLFKSKSTIYVGNLAPIQGMAYMIVVFSIVIVCLSGCIIATK